VNLNIKLYIVREIANYYYQLTIIIIELLFKN